MAELTRLDRTQHATKRWRRITSFAFASSFATLPLAGIELGRAALAMPIAIAKREEKFIPVALLSLRPNTNMFVGPDGRWLGAYVPAILRAYPFRLIRKDQGEDYTVCIADEGTTVVEADSTDPHTEPFFDAEGKFAPATKFALDFLTAHERSRMATDEAMTLLADAGVIRSWELKYKVMEQEVLVNGVYRIDEAVLGALSNDAFVSLRQHSALVIAYAQLLSMGQLGVFDNLAALQGQLVKVREQLAASEAARVAPPVPTLQMVDDGMLRFD